MRRFKIGDKVRIARIAESFIAKYDRAMIERWESMIGDEHYIIGYEESENKEEGYELNTEGNSFWLDEELEPCKETQVLEILRQYRDNKRPDKQAVRDSGVQPDL